jgi:hypothetical protein
MLPLLLLLMLLVAVLLVGWALILLLLVVVGSVWLVAVKAVGGSRALFIEDGEVVQEVGDMCLLHTERGDPRESEEHSCPVGYRVRDSSVQQKNSRREGLTSFQVPSKKSTG